MFLILTTKPGFYRTELTAGLQPVEAYDYVFCGAVRARFIIAEPGTARRVTVIDEATPPVVNSVPIKFFPSFPTLEAARKELRHLVSFGTMQVSLDPVALPRAVAA